MDWASEHIGFVATAYGLSAIVLLGVVMAILHRRKKLKMALAKFPTVADT